MSGTTRAPISPDSARPRRPPPGAAHPTKHHRTGKAEATKWDDVADALDGPHSVEQLVIMGGPGEPQPLRSSSTVVSGRCGRRVLTCCVDSGPGIHRRDSMRCIREFPGWSGSRIPVPTRDRRTCVLLADGDSLARETLLDISADESAAW